MDFGTDKLVKKAFDTADEAQRDIINSQVGFMASAFTSLVSIGVHGLDNVSHGAVSDYLSKLPIATNETMSPQEAKDRIVQNRLTDVTGTLMLAGMKGALDPLAPAATLIDVGNDGVTWGVADMAEDLPGMEVRVTKILGMEIYSYAPIPPWKRAAESGLVNVQVPTAADAQNGFLELISKSNPGEAFVQPLDTAGNARIAVPLGNYFGVVHAPGFSASQMPVTVSSGTTSLNVTLDAPPVPGFDIAPQSTLQTSESGASASFTVALKTKPSANVTLSLSSSDTTEARISKASLLFTPANWSTPQTVVVTGVDDALVDGAQACTIITHPAVSTDAAYNGMDPADVKVLNQDNEESGIPTISLDQLTVAERYQEWVGDPVWGGWWEQFRIVGKGTATGPVGTYLYSYPGSGTSFVMDSWTGSAGGHARAIGNPLSTQFTFEVYTSWYAVSSEPLAPFTVSVEADYWSVDPYLTAKDTKTITVP
jgi:hypothetical protein